MKVLTILSILCVVLNGTAAYAEAGGPGVTSGNASPRAESRHVSIAQTGRTEVARLAADLNRSVLPPNYPQSFAGPSPSSRFGRQIVSGTAGAVGGLFAGAWIGGAIANAGECRGEYCSLGGIMIGAPIGAIAGAIAGAVLARRRSQIARIAIFADPDRDDLRGYRCSLRHLDLSHLRTDRRRARAAPRLRRARWR